MSLLLSSYILNWVVLLILLALVFGILRHIGVLYEHIDTHSTGLRHGQILRDVSLSTMDGEGTNISRFSGTQESFVVVSPGCSSCEVLLQNFGKERATDEFGERIIVIGIGHVQEIRALLGQSSIDRGGNRVTALVDADGAVKRRWGLTATPFTVTVDENLRVTRQITGVFEPGRFSVLAADGQPDVIAEGGVAS